VIRITAKTQGDVVGTKIKVGRKIGNFQWDDEFAKEELLMIYDAIETTLIEHFGMSKQTIKNFIKNEIDSKEIIEN
jgi:hypothetical protein